jgi:Uma2 family endonuclease
MSTTMTEAVPSSTQPAKPRRRKPGRAVVLQCVPWEMYSKLLAAFGDKPNVRLAYDNEVLEIMVPSLEHDFGNWSLASLVPILAEEFALPFRGGGRTTMRLKKPLKGIEADDIFWLANAAKLAGVRQLDLKIHPPPDLAIEVDVSRSSMNRFRIYARLKVPELWRLDGDTITFYTLIGKRYVEATHSRSFPLIAPADLIPVVLKARIAGDQTPVMREFRLWVRQRIAATQKA